MRYRISIDEKKIVEQFKNLRIPSIFKDDFTDRILFVEDVDFDVCTPLLKGKDIPDDFYNEMLERCDNFVAKSDDINEFDEYTLNYYNTCLQVVEIMKKYKQ